jgi:hypothetical protein
MGIVLYNLDPEYSAETINSRQYLITISVIFLVRGFLITFSYFGMFVAIGYHLA